MTAFDPGTIGLYATIVVLLAASSYGMNYYYARQGEITPKEALKRGTLRFAMYLAIFVVLVSVTKLQRL